MRTDRWNVSLVVAALLVLSAGCGDDGEPDAEAEETPSVSPTPTPTALPPSGTVETEAGGDILYSCRGEGTPPMLLEAGSDSAGSEELVFTILEPLGEHTRVCTYDRPGTGGSDRPPDFRRNLDDACEVQDQVIAALELSPPYVLAGTSGGGNLVIGCAQRHPERVAGLVVMEGYHDDPKMMRDFKREEGWSWRTNVEHLDYIDIVDELDQMEMPIGDFPVLIMTASNGDKGNVQNQAYWLDLSPTSRQVVIEGEHELDYSNREGVVREMLKLLDQLR